VQILFFLLKNVLELVSPFNVDAYPEQRHFHMPVQAVLQCRDECKSHWVREGLYRRKRSLPGSSL